VSRATQAITRAFRVDHIESAGKQPLQKSGKHRVNKIDEEIPRGFRDDARNEARLISRKKQSGPRLARPACSQIREA
jgi:hypothetical protein